MFKALIIAAIAGAALWLAPAPAQAVPATPGLCAAITFDNVIEGTNGNDLISLTPGNDLVFVYDGDDIVYGPREGDDCIVNGNGRMRLFRPLSGGGYVRMISRTGPGVCRIIQDGGTRCEPLSEP